MLCFVGHFLLLLHYNNCFLLFSPPQHRTNVEWIVCYFYLNHTGLQRMSVLNCKVFNKKEVVFLIIRNERKKYITDNKMPFSSEVIILSDVKQVRAILVSHCNLPELTTRILPPCLCYTLFISLPIHAGLHSHSVHGLTERGNEHRGGGRRQTERAFPGNLQHSKYAAQTHRYIDT